jgi:succinyl-CoA synthetase beta subunit
MFSKMASQLSNTLLEAEINPLLVRHDGEGVVGVDAVIRFD